MLPDIHTPLEQHLDQISSPRSTNAAIRSALNALEEMLAHSAADQAYNHSFLALQLTFQYNCACRILPFLARSTESVQHLTNHGVIDPNNSLEIESISANLYIALCLLQGLALTHTETKIYLGKPHSLHTLLDLLLASRHLPVSKSSSVPSQPPLTSCILDTLLCVLVDVPQSIRSFETSSGLPAVVKILKRAGTPREVRMKCLEFLYFYLLDETTDGVTHVSQSKHKHSLSGMSTPSLTPSQSFSTTNTSSPRTPHLLSTPFSKKEKAPRIFTPTTLYASKSHDPQTPSGGKNRRTPAHLLILNRPVDFVPVSPTKSAAREYDDTLINDIGQDCDPDDEQDTYVFSERRTTEEKKKLLGGLLGNVDALVEGVRKAGVWGLG